MLSWKNLALASVILFCAVSAVKADTELLGEGASFPAPVYDKWIAEYQKVHTDVRIDYQAKGSGAGISAITGKIVDFGASDAPLSKAELQRLGGAGAVLQIPTVAGAVVLAYNVPGVKQDLKFDGPTIADIYLGNIKKWNDPRIGALNPGVNLPDLDIVPVHRVDGSGTNYIFTNYLAGQSEAFLEKIGAGKSVEWSGGQGGEQNKGVTAAIQSTKGALGYIELTYALQNNISFGLLKNKDGEFVKASPETVSAAGEGALNSMGKSLAVNIWNQPGKAAYPISSFTYLIIPKDLSYLKSTDKARVLVDFVSWATSSGEKLAGDLNYAPLSDGVQKKVAEALASITFDGKPVKGQ